MGPDLERIVRSDIMIVLVGKENGTAITEPLGNNIGCAKNYQDNIFESEASMHQQDEQANKVEQSVINRMEPTQQSGNPPTETPSKDATENSSSFGNTASGCENDDMSDTEAMSKFCDDGFGEDSRMRWVEMQIRRFQSQASKYDKQIEKINQRKHLTSDGSTVADLCAKSLPFSGRTQRQKFMKRKKRKRVEDATDKSTYMAQLNLFSYFGRAFFGRKRSSANVASINDLGNLGMSTAKDINCCTVFEPNDVPVALEFRDDDNSLEQVLWKVGVLQSHLSELKTRLGKVMPENAKEISSADTLRLLVPYNTPTNSPQNNASTNDGEKLAPSSSIASELVPEYSMGDVIPESTVLTRGERTTLTNIIKSTDQPEINKLQGDEGDGHLIYNSIAKELNSVEKVEIQPTVTFEMPKEEQENVVPSVSVTTDLIADDWPNPKKRAKLTSSNNKRKRGRRKVGRWNPRS